MVRLTYFVDFVVWIVLSVAASVIFYIWIGTDDGTWVAKALNFSLFSAIVINLSVYVLAVIHRSMVMGAVNVLFTITSVLAFGYAVVSSFPGTGSRIGNSGADAFSWIGLANFSAAAVGQGTLWFLVPAALVLAFPATIFVAYLYFTDPLLEEVGSADLTSDCYLRVPSYPLDLGKAERISTEAELGLGIFIGEHSPRILRVSGSQAREWQYSIRSFSAPYKLREVPKACATGHPDS